MTLARSPVRLPRSLATWVLRGALPSFVVDAVWPGQDQQHKKQKMPLPPTAYLDGLRGIASIVVFVCHYTELHHGYLTPMYGMGDDHGSHDSVLQLPFVRVLFAGRPMVHIFFVISGFVLAYKPLRLLHAGALDQSHAALASSVFRRPMRLYLPCLVSTLMAAVLMQAGLMGAHARAASWSGQISNWAHAYLRSITWPWAWDHHMMPAYDIHLWTIPIEFVHSMLLFMVLLGLSRLRTRLRQATTLVLIVYAAWCGKWAAIEFLAGLFLAEAHVLQSLPSPTAMLMLPTANSSLPTPETGREKRQKQQHKWLHVLLHSSILVGCLFVAGWPNDKADETPGIRYLYKKTPTAFINNGDGDGNWIVQLFWFSWTGILAVWSVGELPCTRRLFESHVAQYCGKISYAIYIMHGPGLELLQERVLGHQAEPAWGAADTEGYVPGRAGWGVRGRVGIETPMQRTMTWFVGLVILGPMVVWMADLFWRLVDVPIVKLARTVEELCIAPPAGAETAQYPDSAKERE